MLEISKKAVQGLIGKLRNERYDWVPTHMNTVQLHISTMPPGHYLEVSPKYVVWWGETRPNRAQIPEEYFEGVCLAITDAEERYRKSRLAKIEDLLKAGGGRQ